MEQPDSPDFTPSRAELVANNARYAAEFHDSGLALRPRRQLAIVACMDSRMNVFQILGLGYGDAHIVRNAGGVVTDDVIRSLVISQRFLGTREIMLIHHTNCGLQRVNEDQFKQDIETETGLRPWWALESFSDPFANVRQSMRRLQLSPFILHKEHISGFVYDVDSGLLSDASAPPES